MDDTSQRMLQAWKSENYQMSSRLHFQHWLHRYTLGHILDPKIPLPSDDKPFRVADVGCGNGAWMLDLHREQPKAEIHGFDVAECLFPALHWMPKGLQFRVWDARTEIPENAVEAFDIVHVRFLFTAVFNNDFAPLVDNLLRLLKPGGYLQWDEGDQMHVKADAPPGVSAEAMTSLVGHFNNMQAVSNLSVDWLYGLPETLEARGCTVIKKDWISAPPELQRAWSDNMLSVFEHNIVKLPDALFSIPPTEGLTRADFGELFKKACKECGRGVYPNFKLCNYVARKGE